MSNVVGYSARNTQLLVDSRPLEQLELIYIDHGTRRLRARVMYRPDAEGAPTQVVLRSLENGQPVLLALAVPNLPTQSGFLATRWRRVLGSFPEEHQAWPARSRETGREQ